MTIDNLPKKCYSLDEDQGFEYDDEHECIIEFINQNEPKFPFEVYLYVGEEEKITPAMLLPELVDEIDNQLTDICGEWSLPWFKKIHSQYRNLQKDFEKWFEKWLDDNDCKINFHNVENVKKVTYIVRNKDNYEVKK